MAVENSTQGRGKLQAAERLTEKQHVIIP
jgi:hypothetical protein